MGATPELEAMARAMVDGNLDGEGIWDQMGSASRQWFIDCARAALLAIREPSWEMGGAAILPATVETPCRCSGILAITPPVEPIWQAMVDHILGRRKSHD